MGKVYRARDIKLNRDIPLKIPSDAFAIDDDRIARFRRARAGVRYGGAYSSNRNTAKRWDQLET
jgi:hypothetical protein